MPPHHVTVLDRTLPLLCTSLPFFAVTTQFFSMPCHCVAPPNSTVPCLCSARLNHATIFLCDGSLGLALPRRRRTCRIYAVTDLLHAMLFRRLSLRLRTAPSLHGLRFSFPMLNDPLLFSACTLLCRASPTQNDCSHYPAYLCRCRTFHNCPFRSTTTHRYLFRSFIPRTGPRM